MNSFQLVLKQMRQRALSTWLTMLSVGLAVALWVAIIIMFHASQGLFGQSDYGYDSLIGKKGSKLQLVLNTIYNLDVSPGNIPFSTYGQMTSEYKPYVKIAVPFVRGDTLNGIYPIIGTLPKFFGFDDQTGSQPLPKDEVLNYRPGRTLEFGEGHCFAPNKFEGVIGSDVARLTGMKIGDTFQATHTPASPGHPADIHEEKWKVVGILAPTHTAIDRTVYIPLLSFYSIAEHGVGLIAQAKIAEGEPITEKDEDEKKNYTVDPKTGEFKITLDPKVWALSGIMVQSRGGVTLQRLQYIINNGTDIMDVNPAEQMHGFLDTFLKPSQMILLAIASLVTVIAAVSILVSIYNSVSARTREIAILRALGATRGKVLALICLEAGLIGLCGAIVGWIAGHLLGGAGNYFMQEKFGEGFNWLAPVGSEGVYLICVTIVAVLAGLVPALKAYRTPVATNLVAA